jgi:hypothetical protein
MTATARIAGWREDLAVLARQLPARHKAAFHAADEMAWRGAVDELAARVVRLEDPQITVEVARIVAMLGDAHTMLRRDVAERYPLGIYDFCDGLHAVAAPDGAGWAIGARLAGVGDASIEEAVGALAPLVSRENEARLARSIPLLLTDPTILAGAGLASRDGRARYRLIDAAGAHRELALAAAPAPAAPSRPAPAPGETPLWLRDVARPYWFIGLHERPALYVQYNRCEDAARFAALAREALACLDGEGLDRVVIDLRHNGGGDSQVIRPLLVGLARRPHLAGRLHALIGRETFSSGVVAAVELLHLGAVLVGEPTGGRPSCYGEIETLVLPWSGLPISYSTRYFSIPGLDDDALLPHLAAPLSSRDWLEGRDPALEAVLA